MKHLLIDALYVIATFTIFAFIGVILAWRG